MSIIANFIQFWNRSRKKRNKFYYLWEKLFGYLKAADMWKKQFCFIFYIFYLHVITGIFVKYLEKELQRLQVNEWGVKLQTFLLALQLLVVLYPFLRLQFSLSIISWDWLFNCTLNKIWFVNLIMIWSYSLCSYSRTRLITKEPPSWKSSARGEVFPFFSIDKILLNSAIIFMGKKGPKGK